jgi:hypothetical protein
MSILVDWGNIEETLLVWRFGHRWTGEECAQALEDTNRLAQSKPHPVDLIADMRQSISHPSHLFSLGRHIFAALPANLRSVVVLGLNGYWQRITELLNRQVTYRCDNIYFVDHPDDAYNIIELNLINTCEF